MATYCSCCDNSVHIDGDDLVVKRGNVAILAKISKGSTVAALMAETRITLSESQAERIKAILQENS